MGFRSLRRAQSIGQAETRRQAKRRFHHVPEIDSVEAPARSPERCRAIICPRPSCTGTGRRTVHGSASSTPRPSGISTSTGALAHLRDVSTWTENSGNIGSLTRGVPRGAPERRPHPRRPRCIREGRSRRSARLLRRRHRLAFARTKPAGGDYKGIDQVMGLFARLFELTGGTFRLEVHDVLANDEHGVVLATAKAEKGGKTLSDNGVQVFHLRDGKVTESWLHPSDQYEADEFFS